MMKLRMMRWASNEEVRNVYKIFVGKPLWKRPLGRRRRGRCENSIVIDLEENGPEVNWFYLTQNKDRCHISVKTVMSLRVQYKTVNFFTNSATISFARGNLFHGIDDDNDDHHHIDGLRLCICTATSMGLMFIPPGDI
jgi:hypothetical protein